MNTHDLAAVFVGLVLLFNSHGQNSGTPGFYEISSGEYIECCGIAGENRVALPNASQRFVRFSINANIASMSILGEDMQTVFSITPFCPPSQQAVFFNFDGGLVFPDRLVFHVDPGPDGLFWNYTLSNSPAKLSMEGLVGLAQNNCVDVPDKFTHTNVVANLVTPPDLELRGYSQDGPLLIVHGRAGWLTVVEASSDLQTWAEIARDIMPANLCLTCPQLEVRDAGAGGLTPRFYRPTNGPEEPRAAKLAIPLNISCLPVVSPPIPNSGRFSNCVLIPFFVQCFRPAEAFSSATPCPLRQNNSPAKKSTHNSSRAAG